MRAPPDQIRNDRRRLQNPYAHVGQDGELEAVAPKNPSDIHDIRRQLENPYAGIAEDGGVEERLLVGFNTSRRTTVSPAELTRGHRTGASKYRRAAIQQIARRMHIEIWNRRSDIWSDHQELSAIEMLDPSIDLRLLGYEVHLDESLGQAEGAGKIFEVAGEIDNLKKIARVSRRFSTSVRNFTAAHELGHAVLHPESTELHRDRALDGAAVNGRPSIEWQADIFATNFLMPERLVRHEFENSFVPPPFSLSDETAFGLRARGLQDLETQISTIRDLSRMIASAEHFSGNHFVSLASRFSVSVEAMAIRLEELRLIRYE